MALVKDNAIIANDWINVADEDGVPAQGNVIVSLSRWKAEHGMLTGRSGLLGVRLASCEAPEEIRDDLESFDLIAIEFPVFGDGRGYSIARILRERFGYKGELRAIGNVLRDQLLFMQRCGIDAFEINSDDDKALANWLAAQKEISVFFQPTADGRDTAMSLRERRRQSIKVSRTG